MTLTNDVGQSPNDLLDELPQMDSDVDFGSDIVAAHEYLLSNEAALDVREQALRVWLQKHQPCLFGRLAARETRGASASKGLAINICIVDDSDFILGTDRVKRRIWSARKQWKESALAGVSSAFLILFNSRRLAFATPGPELAKAALRLAELYLTEMGELYPDVVYTESVPLLTGTGKLELFKASTQLFYTSAHTMRNHDRRFPGGLAIVVNAPGHYARSLVQRGLASSFEEAVTFTASTAMRSVGNGGISHPACLKSSWHHDRTPEDKQHTTLFAATYQVDVLVQSDVVADAGLRLHEHRPEDVWGGLHIDYISTRPTSDDDPDFGWFNGMPVEFPAKFFNPWLPRVAENTPEFNY